MQCTNHATTRCLKLLKLSDFFLCPWHIHMRCLSTFSAYGWAYGFSFTSLPPWTLPQICESWLKSYLMQLCKPYHYTLVEAVEPFKLHPSPCHIYMRCMSTFSGCGWACVFTFTPLTPWCFPRFVRVGWYPTWCKCTNHATTLWLRLLDLSNCIQCPWLTYMRCLSTFSGYRWAYGFTFTSIPPQTLPQNCESLVKSYLMQVCKPCHYTLVEAVEPFKLHPKSISYLYEVFEHLLRLWMGIWLHTHTITATDVFFQIFESLLKSYLKQVCKPCHYALVEAEEPLFLLMDLSPTTKITKKWNLVPSLRRNK